MRGAWWLAAAVGIAFAGWAIWPVMQARTSNDSVVACQSNLRMVANALSHYATDHDNRLPPANHWGTVLDRYLQDLEGFRCPTARAFGYAFHRDFGSKNLGEIVRPELEVFVYDSSILGPNVTDNLESLPSPPRHSLPGNPKAGVNCGLFGDGHAATVVR